MAVNWALGVPQGDAGQSFQQGYQNALLQRQNEEDRQFRRDQLDQQVVQQKQQQQVQVTERHRNDIRLGAGIARDIEQHLGRPMDEQGWQMVRSAAQNAGVDLTEVPEHFDANYYQQLQAAARQIESARREPYTLGEGDVRYDGGNNVIGRGGPRQPRYYPVPPGGRLELDPSYQGPTTDAPAQGGGAFQDGQTEVINGVTYVRQGGRWVPATNEAPAFHPTPGGPAPGQGNFPR